VNPIATFAAIKILMLSATVFAFMSGLPLTALGIAGTLLIMLTVDLSIGLYLGRKPQENPDAR
jgi:hypothetical protein